MNDTTGTWLTQEAHDRLVAELADLETEGREELRKRILAAREEGDLRENAEYHQAKEDQGFAEARIRQIRQILDNAKVGERPAGDTHVDHGAKVTLRDDDGDVETYAYAAAENRIEGMAMISPESPLGAALRGKRPGDVVTYEAPAGSFTVEVVSVESF